MQQLHDRHKGQRGFIIGTGASLLQHSPALLAKLQDEVTFGVSRLHQWRGIPFTPTYHLVAEWAHVTNLEQMRWDDVRERFYVAEQNRGYADWTWVPKAPSGDYLVVKGMTNLGERFQPLRNGRGSVASAVQLAVWMGCEPIYLLGCELTNGGRVWAPDDERGIEVVNLDRSRQVFHSMAVEMKRENRHLYDCTPGGTLNDKYVQRKGLGEVLNPVGIAMTTAPSTTNVDVEVKGERVLGGEAGVRDRKPRVDRKAPRKDAPRARRKRDGV